MADYAHPEVLVDTQWLEDHLHDANLRILEVDMSPEPYKAAHIPGAMYWNIFTDLLQPDLHMNLQVDAMAALLSRSGITAETIVIAYGSYPGTGGWIFWLLNLFGHRHVRVVNGGHQKWMAEGRPVTDQLSTFAPTQYRVSPPDQQLRIAQTAVHQAMNNPDQVLLDVRTLAEYRGEQFLMKPPEGEERAGHIPGAIHLEHLQTLNEDGTFKSLDALQALYQDHGITPDREILPYCAIGARAGYIWFVLKYLLGYPQVRNYDGSWNEWSRIPDAPVAP
ncbi:MAG: sulfurtransferase [Leptolyngbyaceae cyanobacterium]